MKRKDDKIIQIIAVDNVYGVYKDGDEEFRDRILFAALFEEDDTEDRYIGFCKLDSDGIFDRDPSAITNFLRYEYSKKQE